MRALPVWAVLVGQRAHRLETPGHHGRQHQLAHTGCARTRNHVGAVGIERRRVEVAMGVDPGHRPIMPCRQT